MLCRQMEKDIEERLRQKYAMIDRTDPSAIQAAQQVLAYYCYIRYNWIFQCDKDFVFDIPDILVICHLLGSIKTGGDIYLRGNVTKFCQFAKI